jgi:hypothetical protein
MWKRAEAEDTLKDGHCDAVEDGSPVGPNGGSKGDENEPRCRDTFWRMRLG